MIFNNEISLRSEPLSLLRDARNDGGWGEVKNKKQ